MLRRPAQLSYALPQDEVKRVLDKGKEEGIAEGETKGEAKGRAEGKAEGLMQGLNSFLAARYPGESSPGLDRAAKQSAGVIQRLSSPIARPLSTRFERQSASRKGFCHTARRIKTLGHFADHLISENDLSTRFRKSARHRRKPSDWRRVQRP